MLMYIISINGFYYHNFSYFYSFFIKNTGLISLNINYINIFYFFQFSLFCVSFIFYLLLIHIFWYNVILISLFDHIYQYGSSIGRVLDTMCKVYVWTPARSDNGFKTGSGCPFTIIQYLEMKVTGYLGRDLKTWFHMSQQRCRLKKPTCTGKNFCHST